MTYAELDRGANAIARRLIAAGIRPGDRVGIQLPKDLEMLPAVYGVLKSGAAFVPLAAPDPLERRAFILSDCGVNALIASSSAASELVPALGAETFRTVVVLDDGSGPAELACPSLSYEEAVGGPEATDPGVPIIDMDLCFVMYTSGSTGVPKGVMQTHRALLACAQWWTSLIGVDAGDRLAVVAPLHFIASAFMYLSAAYVGATAVVVPDRALRELGPYFAEERVTLSLSVPTPYIMMMRAGLEPGSLPDLRNLIFGGDRFPPRDLRMLKEALPATRLWHCYGSTEACGLTYYPVERAPEGNEFAPIGRGWGNTQVFALTADGRPAGIGEEGELHVRGAVVMQGYWGHPDRNAEILVQNPLQPNVPELVYRTGDMVMLREDGNFEFMGRRDQQIKSKGYRIELGEVEAAVQSHPAVLEAVAVPLPHPEWTNVLVAFVVLKDDGLATAGEIKAHVGERLPRIMVPRRIEIVESIPRTTTDKVDRQALIQAASRKPTDAEE